MLRKIYIYMEGILPGAGGQDSTAACSHAIPEVSKDKTRLRSLASTFEFTSRASAGWFITLIVAVQLHPHAMTPNMLRHQTIRMRLEAWNG